jgi:hypothetical protein
MDWNHSALIHMRHFAIRRLLLLLIAVQAFGGERGPVEDAYRVAVVTDKHAVHGRLAYADILVSAHLWRLGVIIQEDSHGTWIQYPDVAVCAITEQGAEITPVKDNPFSKVFESDGKTSAMAQGLYQLTLDPGDRIVAVKVTYLGVSRIYSFSVPYDPNQAVNQK